MKQTIIAMVFASVTGYAVAAQATVTGVAVASSTIPSRSWVASGVLETAQGAYETQTEDRFEPLRAVSITSRPGSFAFGREPAHPVNELPVERRANSKVIAKDIRGDSSSLSVSAGITVVSFGKALPDATRASAVEMRAITRVGAPSNRMMVAQNEGPSVSSTEELHEVLQDARSPQGRSGVVAVDIGRPVDVPLATARVVRPAPDTGAAVTIVGRPGQRVLEITDEDFRELDTSAPVLNQVNTEAIAQEQAAQEALDVKNEELRAAREEQDAEAQADRLDAAAKAAAPPPPRDTKTVRRYDWRKGIYVRVPEDAPPVPAPGIATGPAGLVGDSQTTTQDGTVLRGRIRRLPSTSDATATNEPNGGDAPR